MSETFKIFVTCGAFNNEYCKKNENATSRFTKRNRYNCKWSANTLIAFKQSAVTDITTNTNATSETMDSTTACEAEFSSTTTTDESATRCTTTSSTTRVAPEDDPSNYEEYRCKCDHCMNPCGAMTMRCGTAKTKEQAQTQPHTAPPLARTVSIDGEVVYILTKEQRDDFIEAQLERTLAAGNAEAKANRATNMMFDAGLSLIILSFFMHYF